MITQILLNWLRDLAVDWIMGMFPAPPEWLDFRVMVLNAAVYLRPYLDPLGALIPWSTVSTIVGFWVGLLVIWGGVLVVRTVAWAVGR